MESINTHRPINRTLAVIDGGLNLKNGTLTPPTAPKPKLLDQVRQAIRTRHYSDKTEKAYVHWIKRYIFFHNKRHPMEMAEPEIGRFLSSLATEGHVSASTQNQAFNAVLFLYHQVLAKKISLVDGVVRAKRARHAPVVLTRDEVKKIADCMNGVPRLMTLILYGADLRLIECCRLRVKDIDFAQNEIMVRSGKGNKDRHTPLPTIQFENHFFSTFDSLNPNMRPTSKLVRDVLLCLTHSSANIRMPARNGVGSGYSRRRAIS
jgi:site-specific recombinase XerC